MLELGFKNPPSQVITTQPGPFYARAAAPVARYSDASLNIQV